jgi:hypothetical protein
MAKKANKNTPEPTILENIRKIENELKGVGFSPKLFEVAREQINAVCNYLEVTSEETVLFSLIFAHMVNESPPEVSDIAKYMNIDVISFLPHMHLFENLIKKGYIERRRTRKRSSDDTFRNKIYLIDSELMECIIHQKPRPASMNKENVGSLEILQEIFLLIGQCGDYQISQFELIQDCTTLLHNNRELPVIKEILSMDLGIQHRIVFCYIIWKAIISQDADLDDPCDAVTKSTSEKIRMLNEFASGENPLTKGDWIAIKEGRFNNELEANLTDRSIELLKQENIVVKMAKMKKIATRKPDDIHKKELFFNPEEANQWWRIHSLLQESNFKPIQERLNEKGMSSGFTILFHGDPGTGKTESVLQLARESGREIMQVDSSMTKSMWFGESEKFMKRIFTNYEELRKNAFLSPILFFNEADAILNKRKTDMSSNVAQTENALQNILLEGLENFKGIFIATTNLIQNLDEAFDRRFIYKMRFSLPNLETSVKIWQKAFPHLTEKQCNHMASKFHFSGGQITNIVRKCEIEYLLNGKIATIDLMEEFCEKEILIQPKNTVKIGF